MSAAGLAVELLFKAAGWIPTARAATIVEAHVRQQQVSGSDEFIVLSAG